jgi:hypothetical protein
MKRKLLPRIFITLLGAALILWGAGKIALGIIGEPEKAVITHIRREGGERTDIKPGRYTYNISYTFTLPDGKEINGFTKQIGDGVYRKADGTSTVQIRYLPGFPYFSALEKEVGMGVGPLVLIVAGGVLVFLMVRPTKVDNGHK